MQREIGRWIAPSRKRNCNRYKMVTRRTQQGIDSEKQILGDETGRHSVSIAYRNEGGSLLHSGIKKNEWCTDQHLLRARFRAENQYESLRRALGIVLQRQGWKVGQISFIAGARSLNEQDLRETLKFFQVPEARIESIGSKLAMRIFDEYTNILRYIYSTRFNGGSTGTGTSWAANPPN